MPTAATLTVIIVSWNVRELLERCLATLRADLDRAGLPAAVWVVDNASSDGSAAMVRERHPWVQLETPGENLGFVRANNLILDRLHAEGLPEYVWLLNPDTEVQPGAVAALRDFCAAHPRAGLIGPQLLNSDGSRQESAFRFPGLLQPLFDLGRLPARFYGGRLNGRYPASDTPHRVDHPLGAAMWARGAAVAQVGALDEAFFMYCEEIDWAWRMRQAGWEAWLVPAARVLHHGGASTSQARPVTTAHLWESRARLYRKHRGPVTRALVGAAVRRHFTRRAAESPEWDAAHRRILAAWGQP